MFVFHDAEWPIIFVIITKWTLQNPVAKQILDWVLYGMPKRVTLLKLNFILKDTTKLFVEKIVYCEEVNLLHYISKS